jgi:hypothetical protein
MSNQQLQSLSFGAIDRPEPSFGEPPCNRLVACAILGHRHPPRLFIPRSNPYRELCARKGRFGRPVDLFVLLHISHCPERVPHFFRRCSERIGVALSHYISWDSRSMLPNKDR